METNLIYFYFFIFVYLLGGKFFWSGSCRPHDVRLVDFLSSVRTELHWTEPNLHIPNIVSGPVNRPNST